MADALGLRDLRQAKLGDVLLVGDRVRLRPVRKSDAECAFAAVHGRHEILEWLVWPGPETVDDLRPVFVHWAAYGEDADNYQLTITGLDDDRFVGSIGVRFAGHPREGQIGYWLATERWGLGWMSEAIGLVAHLCFEHLAARRLYAIVFAGNDASRRVLEKNGFEEVTGSGTVAPLEIAREQWAFALGREAWSALDRCVRPRHEAITLRP